MEKLNLLYSRAAIAQRVCELGEQINSEYAGKQLVLVCVLKGAFMFFSDLAKTLTMNPEMDFVRVASYGSGTCSGGLVSFTKDIELNILGKHVILVEDIIDTGRTVEFLHSQFMARGATSLKIAAFLDKPMCRVGKVEADYTGFTIPDAFVVGYGLDYAEKYRELPEIYILEQ